jgi:hypothetical protein
LDIALERAFDLVALDRTRAQLFVGKLARLGLPVALLFVQGKIHFNSLKIRYGLWVMGRPLSSLRITHYA